MVIHSRARPTIASLLFHYKCVLSKCSKQFFEILVAFCFGMILWYIIFLRLPKTQVKGPSIRLFLTRVQLVQIGLLN